ncbi:Hdr-like menaquinol oxidoreductase iron-sulfur subunit 1 [Gammaproteobacteria bacterium]
MRNESADQGRRGFLGTATATVVGLVAAPGLSLVALARSPEAAVDDKSRWGLLIDTAKCSTDCTACTIACSTENGLTSHDRPASDAQWLRKVQLKEKATGRTLSLPVGCQHCERPPCVDVCPTGASFRRADGIVLVDKHICIGCRYCMMACPYKARSFGHEEMHDQKPYSPRGKGTVEACTLCVHRVDAGRLPACVEACQKDGHQAMIFGDLKDPNSTIAKRLAAEPTHQLREALNLNTGVRYQGV